MSKSKSKQEEALQFLDDLDSISPAASAANAQGQNPEEVLAFLDEIAQKSTAEPARLTAPQADRPSSRAGTPTIRKSSERVRVGGGAALLKSSSTPPLVNASPTDKNGPASTTSEQTAESQAGGGWGWGTVWSSASAALQQAKTVVDEQVKNLPANEQARKVIEYARIAQLDRLGQDFKRVGLSTLTDLLNVVAPPISKHEVIQVWLSHDMKGYDGTETLVYRALARVMEQVEGGDLVINRGTESKPKDPSDASRDINAVEGYDAALKLAEANLDALIKSNVNATEESPSSINTPTTYSQVYLRIQPFYSDYNEPPRTKPASDSAETTTQTRLQFILYLSDPTHQLVHMTVTQTIPAHWVEIWDEYEWVEDLVAEALRLGVEVVGQEYVVARMGWGGKDKGKAKADASESDNYEVVDVDAKGEP